MTARVTPGAHKEKNMTMSLRTKKIILISLLIIVTLLVGYGIYYLFFRSVISPPDGNLNGNANGQTNDTLPSTNTNRVVNIRNGNENTNGATTLPDIAEVAQGGVTKVSSVADAKVEYGAPADNQTGYVYYDKEANKFYKILANGERVELSDKEFYNVSSVAWSSERDQAIISYPDGSNVYQNFRTGQTVTLPKEIEEVEFSNNGTKIAYEFVGEDERERWLGVANPDGTGQQIIQALGDRADRVEVNWSPDAQVVATYRESIGVDEEEIYFIGQYGENFKSIVVDGSGFTGKWTEKGDKLLYSVYNSESDYKPMLKIVDAKGDNTGLNHIDLNVATWPDKCAFGGGSTLYCAVPTELSEGSGISPDLARFTKDNFYQIDLVSGQKTLLAIPYTEPGSGYNAAGVYLSADGSYLYFHDKITGRLEKIKLK